MPAPGTTVAAAMLRETEAWARTQSELLTGVEAIWADWLKRQSEAFDAGSQSLRRMFDCRNPAELMQVQQQWVADAMRRAASDFSSLAGDALAVTRRVGGANVAAMMVPSQMSGRAVDQTKPDESAATHRAAAE